MAQGIPPGMVRKKADDRCASGRGCGEAQPQQQQTTKVLEVLGEPVRLNRAAAGLRHSRTPTPTLQHLALAAVEKPQDAA